MKRPKLPITIGGYTLDYFYNTSRPTFAVYDKDMELVCVCLYRCGAEEVIKRLSAREDEDEKK